MKLLLTALFGTLLPSISALTAASTSSPTGLVVIIDDNGLPFPRLGYHMVNPRGLTPRLSSFPMDFSDLPVKTGVNIDGEDIVIFAQKPEFVTKVIPILKEYLCSNSVYAPLFPIMCRIGHETASPAEPSHSTLRLTNSVTSTRAFTSDRIPTPHRTSEYTGKGEIQFTGSRNNHGSSSHWPTGRLSRTGDKTSTDKSSSPSPSSSILNNEGERPTVIGNLTRSDGFPPLPTIPEQTPRTRSSSEIIAKPPLVTTTWSWTTVRSSPFVTPDISLTSRDPGTGSPVTETRRSAITKSEQNPRNSQKSSMHVVPDTTSWTESMIHEPTSTKSDTYSPPRDFPFIRTTKKTELSQSGQGTNTASFPRSLESKTSTPSYSEIRSSSDRPIFNSTSDFRPPKSWEKLTPTEVPSWRTIRTRSRMDESSDRGNGGRGHGEPSSTRTKPEWPKELTGTITVWPYPTSTAVQKRTIPTVGDSEEPITTVSRWEKLGIATSPVHDNGGEPKTESGDGTDSEWEAA